MLTKQQEADLRTKMIQAQTMANASQFGDERQQWLNKYEQLRQRLNGQISLSAAQAAPPPYQQNAIPPGVATPATPSARGANITLPQNEILGPAQEKINQLKDALADAQRNANVGSWGGSAEDAAHWQRRASEIQQALGGAQKTFDDIQSKLPNIPLTPENKDLIKTALMSNNPIDVQALKEYTASSQQIDESNAKLAAFRNQLENQYFGGTGKSLQDALSSTSGDIGQLNSFLGKQQSATFNQELRPLINMQMGGQGLLDSGANIELQSRALGQLERARQADVMQAALGARAQIQGLGRQDVLGDIGQRQQQLTDISGLQRAGITMQFQQQLEQQREQLARELSNRQGAQGPGMWQQIIGGVGMAGSIAAAPFTGGTSLAALPAFAQYGFGSQGGQLGAGAGALSQGFFRNDTYNALPRPRTATVQNGQMTGYQDALTGLRY